jgi:hypothetical protein
MLNASCVPLGRPEATVLVENAVCSGKLGWGVAEGNSRGFTRASAVQKTHSMCHMHDSELAGGYIRN